MMLSGVTPYSSYQVLGIYGNPTSLRPVDRISDADRKSSPLVTVTEEPQQTTWEDLKLPKVTDTAVSSFSDVMKKQALTGKNVSESDTAVSLSGTMQNVLNDTIGLMGYQNPLRESLTGISFQKF